MQTTVSESLAVLGKIDAQLANNTTLTSGYMAAKYVQKFLALFIMGATDIGVTCKVQKATDSSGTGVIDHASATAFLSTDDNKLAEINVLSDNLGEGYTHIRMSIVIANGSTGANVAAVCLASHVRYDLPKTSNIAAVAYTVNS